VLYPAINLQQQELPDGAARPELRFGGARQVVVSINRYERKKNIALAIAAVAMGAGLGRIVTLYYRSSALFQTHKRIRCLCF
jgi:hypothetical protein